MESPELILALDAHCAMCSGDITDVGMRQGKYYSLNVPLNDGIDDRTYERLFKVTWNTWECS